MSSFVSRLVACLVAVVAVLQLVHLVLLNQLESRRLNQLNHFHQQQFNPNHPKTLQSHGVEKNRRKLIPSDRSSKFGSNIPENELFVNRLLREEEGAIVDSSGEFRVVFDIAGPQRDMAINLNIPPEKSSVATANTDDFSIDEDIVLEPDSSVDVTLVTFSDLYNGYRYLIPLIERWNGPLSLALFAPNSSTVESTLDFIAQARLCSDLVRQYVNFHLVFPLVESHSSGRRFLTNRTRLSSKNRKKASREFDSSKECQNFLKDLSQSYSSKESPYSFQNNYNNQQNIPSDIPSNLLRNVARKRVVTDFSLVTPIDMLPSEDLRSNFVKFTRRREGNIGDKTVYVIPAFETKNGETPGCKSELLELVHKYQARPFHFELCWKCQVHTDYASWERELGVKRDLSVIFEIIWKDPWEPFFIADSSVPIFDEGFRHLAFDRLSQLCELHVSGYKFAILNEPFLVHPGYISPPPFQVNKNYNLDNSRAHFRQFKHQMKIKYPHSTRRCY